MEEKILALYACGMSQRDISEQIKHLYDVEISDGLVSKIVEKVTPEVNAWQNRPLESVYPFIFIYEDNVSGKLSDDRFSKMSRRYEDEQKEISERIKTLRAEMDKLSSKAVTADMFISTVRKYTRAKALTPRMLNMARKAEQLGRRS